MNHRKLNVIAFATLALAAGGSSALAGTETTATTAKETVEAPPPAAKVNLLLNVEFADKYVTPRGMIVREDGLTIQPLLLAFVSLYQGDGLINRAKLVGGVWNDFGTSRVAKDAPFISDGAKTNYTEVDPILGVSLGFAKYFTLDVTYTSFVEQILSIETSHHLETKLSIDDSALLKGFALHPYVSFWYELSGKATDADVPQAVFGPSAKSGSHPNPGSSYYFEVGIDPSYTFEKLGGLKIDAPCRVLLPDERFYGEYYQSASVVGLFELGARATMPLNFMPKGYGNWSIHAGFKYLNFVDDNLYHLNTFNAPGETVRTTWQAYGGVSVFF